MDNFSWGPFSYEANLYKIKYEVSPLTDGQFRGAAEPSEQFDKWS